MLTKETIMTIPSVAELTEIMQAFPEGEFPVATDFARANGLRAALAPRAGVDKVYSGQIWTRNVAEDGQVITYDCLHKRLGTAAADENTIAVLPRILNPEFLGFDLTVLNGRSVLTFNGCVTCYPDDNVGYHKEDELTHKVLQAADKVPVGSFYTDYSWPRYGQKKHKCYYCDGENYVRGVSASPVRGEDTIFSNGEPCGRHDQHWYRCRPVRAMRCRDGSIQLLDQLFAQRLENQKEFQKVVKDQSLRPGDELDLDLLALGGYLYATFMPDLQRSANFTNVMITHKLAKLKGINQPHSLKKPEESSAKITNKEIDNFLRFYFKKVAEWDITPEF